MKSLLFPKVGVLYCVLFDGEDDEVQGAAAVSLSGSLPKLSLLKWLTGQTAGWLAGRLDGASSQSKSSYDSWLAQGHESAAATTLSLWWCHGRAQTNRDFT